MPIRIYHFEGLRNFRDIGGYETPYGSTSFHVLYRSWELTSLSENDKKKLSKLGIRSIIDLRSKDYIRSHPDQLWGDLKVYSTPVPGDGRIPASREDMIESYLEMVSNPFQAKEVFKAIAYSPKPAIIHCSAGKDRTGIFVYLLLLLNGVCHEDANADYLLSFPFIEKEIKDAQEGKSIYPSCIAGADVGFLTSFMEEFNKRFGSLDNYLESIGLSDDDINLLRNLLGKQEKSCGAVVFYHDKILVEHMIQGHYSIPKGHVEPFDKDELDTATREIKEECQIKVKFIPGFEADTVYSPKAGVAKRVVFFLAEAESDQVVPQKEEVRSIYFLSPRDALTTLSHDSDRDVVNKAINYYFKQNR